MKTQYLIHPNPNDGKPGLQFTFNQWTDTLSLSVADTGEGFKLSLEAAEQLRDLLNAVLKEAQTFYLAG